MNKYIPINDKKIPMVKGWQTSTEDFQLNGYGVGLVCGKLSNNAQGVDIDCKYDNTGTLFADYKKAVNDANPNLLKKLCVQKTANKGYHFLFRCQDIGGNEKLASRPCTEAEIASEGQVKVKVLIETRGEGGYLAVFPTPGYEVIYGDLNAIQEISPDERETLLNVARTFNQVIPEYTPRVPKQQREQQQGLSPFDDYNQRGDVLVLLESHGWTVVKSKGERVLVKRPGSTSSLSSGSYNEGLNLFSVFSTSTEFEVGKGYRPYAVFGVLECNSDWSECSRRLYDMGYGDRRQEKKTEQRKKEAIPEKQPITKDKALSFIADIGSIDRYLHAVRTGTLKVGLSTGIPELDKHYLHKDAQLEFINGHDNVGKSVVIWYIMLLGSLLHGKKWTIIAFENSPDFITRKLIEFYCCRELKDVSVEKELEAKAFVRKHFTLLRNDEPVDYMQVLDIFSEINKVNKQDGCLIDPYNGLDEPDGNSHHYHYDAMRKMRRWVITEKASLMVNMHAVSEALRKVDKEGYPEAPNKADTEGGGKAGNKPDQFITIHRKTQHPTLWNRTELHIRKVKETETGGSPTPKDSPVYLTSLPGVVGFVSADGINPVTYYWDMKRGVFPKINNPVTNVMTDLVPEYISKSLKANADFAASEDDDDDIYSSMYNKKPKYD